VPEGQHEIKDSGNQVIGTLLNVKYSISEALGP
jgi:hypothetical protein